MGHASNLNDQLARNGSLSTKLQGLLPPGANLQEASHGFKNLGQFAAAAHVSRNLGIPFDQLKAKTTGPDAMSMGKAIHELKPDLDSRSAKAEAKRAERQARESIGESKAER